MSNVSIEELRILVDADPASPAFVEYARALLEQGAPAEAMSICLRGLSADTSSVKGRLALAESFFVQGFLPFAVREVEELARQLPENDAISKLRTKIDPRYTAAPSTDQDEKAVIRSEVAEEDFSIDDLASLDTES